MAWPVSPLFVATLVERHHAEGQVFWCLDILSFRTVRGLRVNRLHDSREDHLQGTYESCPQELCDVAASGFLPFGWILDQSSFP